MSQLLEDELVEIFKHLVSSRDPVTLHVMQGRAQSIKDLRDLVRDAPTILEKLRESTL